MAPRCAHPQITAGCPVCAIARRDPRYRSLWWPPPPPKAQPAPPSDCVHFGAPTGRTALCPTCRGGVQLKTFGCELHDECTPAKAAPGLACCARCPDRLPRQIRYDERSLWVGAPGKRFNSALMEYEGGYLLAARNGWAGSEIYLGRLDRDLRPIGPPWRLDLRQRDGSAYGAEDPYLFRFRDRVHVGYVGVEGGASIRRTNVLYARLTTDLRVERRFFPQLPARRAWEKSHMFYEHQGELFAVYTINPHRIIRVDGDRAEQAYESPGPKPWNPGTDMRGGASPVLAGGEWYHYFHSRYENPRRYFMGLYTFAAVPPFRPLRIIPEPVIEADPSTNVGPDRNYCACFFPRGAVLAGDHWVISAGAHDRWTELHRLSRASIEARLVPVEGVPS